MQLALFIVIERSTAVRFPYLHRQIMTKTKSLITLLLTEEFALLFACLQFTEIKGIFNAIYLHVFFSAPMLVIIITICVTHWKIKNRKRVTSGEIPQPLEQLELHRKRNAQTAMNYLRIASSYLVPVFVCTLPWHAVNIVHGTCTTNGVRFFWQRFSAPLLFLPDVVGPIIITFNIKKYFLSETLYSKVKIRVIWREP